MIDLNETEREIYSFIKNSIEVEGYAPSVRDICASLSIKSTSTVHAYLARLEQKGYIVRGQGKSRALKLVDNNDYGSRNMIRVPLLGKVTAGMPITAVENYEGYVDYPVAMVGRSEDLFALRVSGESMVDAGILDGDIVIVQKTVYADDGTIVVAMIDDEATVKKIYHDIDCIRLQPCNPNMKPIYARNVSVIGRVVANFRFY